MPIYEFYCAACHKVFNFFSRRIDTEKRPACPQCSRPNLQRMVSRFSISKGRSESAAEDDAFPEMDEDRMENLLAEIGRDAENLNEDDPRQMAQLMRRLYDSTGLPLGETTAEAIRRLEAGEPPEQIEEELGEALEQEDPFCGGKLNRGSLARRLQPPEVDETLYDL